MAALYSLAAEILATATGLAGAWYVAEEGDRAGLGFAFFLASNAAWMSFGYMNGHWILIVQQLGFTAFALRGIWKKSVRPRAALFAAVYRATRPYRGVLASAHVAYRCSR
jgi:hypothetical protein